MCHLPLKAFFPTKAFLLVGFVFGPLSLIATSCPNTNWKVFAEAWAADQWLCHCRKQFLLRALTTNSLWPGRCGTPGPPICDGMLWAQPCAGLVWLTRAAVATMPRHLLHSSLPLFCDFHWDLEGGILGNLFKFNIAAQKLMWVIHGIRRFTSGFHHT